eukprot:2880595-Rhodomonas_salina.1
MPVQTKSTTRYIHQYQTSRMPKASHAMSVPDITRMALRPIDAAKCEIKYNTRHFQSTVSTLSQYTLNSLNPFTVKFEVLTAKKLT